uniref:hypothetical protein n=1 Tax=Alicyclobacillus kakegawensis TaxID=392012 RepID=UPI000A826B87
QSEEQGRELLKVHEKLLEKDQELKRAMDDYKTEIERVSQERNTEFYRRIRELLAENEELKKETQALKAEMDLLATTGQEENKQLKRANEELLTENQALRKENEELKKQAMQLAVDSFERLKAENEQLRMKLANLNNNSGESKIQGRSNQYATHLHGDLNSLTAPKNVYESLFSFAKDTPHVRPDPVVWNIIYEAVPPGYSIPDPEFTNELIRNVASGLFKPALSSGTNSDGVKGVSQDITQQA